MIIRRNWCGVLGLLAMVCLFQPGPSSAAGLPALVEAWGLADDNSPAVAHSKNIFNRVYAVADKYYSRSTRLFVLDTRDSAVARALPDGNIVISLKTLEKCFSGVDGEEGDARLAFVLGHELGHLVLRRPAAPESAGFADDGVWLRMRERDADDLGFLYATMAGFNTRSIVADESAASAFFASWYSNIRSSDEDTGHESPATRASLLKAKLIDLEKHAALFFYGMRLAYLGRYDDAASFLEAFQTRFPSKTVLADLGYVYLQMARMQMDEAISDKYWLPAELLSSVEIPAAAKSLKATAGLSVNVQRLLEQAESWLQRAVAADSKFTPALKNLATVYMYLGRMHRARDVIEQAAAAEHDDPELQAMAALVTFEQIREVDMWPHTVRTFRELIQAYPDNAMLKYNLARLYEVRGRKGKASGLWASIVDAGNSTPPEYLRIACRLAGRKCAGRPMDSVPDEISKACTSLRRALKAKATGKYGLASDALKAGFAGEVGQSYVQVVKTMHNREYLSIDGSLEMAVAAGIPADGLAGQPELLDVGQCLLVEIDGRHELLAPAPGF